MIPGEDDPASSLVAEVRTGKILPVRKGKDEREETRKERKGGREGEQGGGGGKRESSGAPFSFELNPFYVRFCRDTTCYRFSFVY